VNPKRLQAIEVGRVSDTLLNVFGEKLTHHKERQLKKVLTTHRMGERDKVHLELAAYCALEDFESELKKEVMAGRNAAKELVDNGIG
jgi:hypothetical protein